MTAAREDRMTACSAAHLAKRLTASFALAALGGCATMNYTGTTDCIERSGTSLNIPLLGSISSRADRFSTECATARAATTIAGMRKKDGTPDMKVYAFASALYEESNPEVRRFMDRMLKEDMGKSIEQIRFEIKREAEPVACTRAVVKRPDGTTTTGFRCVPAQNAATR